MFDKRISMVLAGMLAVLGVGGAQDVSAETVWISPMSRNVRIAVRFRPPTAGVHSW